MKTLRFLILGLLATTAVMPSFKAAGQSEPSAPVAEAVTPQIQALARGLQNDPVRIYNYVHDHIRYVHYFGSKKGAELTLLEKSGNDFDQSALLTALLHAAGYTNTGYQFGWIGAPYDDPSGEDLHHWFQLTLVNTNWTDTLQYLDTLFDVRGYPEEVNFAGYTNLYLFQQAWVTLTVGATTYWLDPAVKVSEPVSGINLASAMGLSSNSVMSAAGGTDTGVYATNLNEANVRGLLTGYTTNILNYIQSNAPNAGVHDILGGWKIVPSTNTTLSQIDQNFPFDRYPIDPPLDWTYEPTDMMATLKITFAGTNYQWFMPQLEGRRISLTFSNNGVAQLWQEDTLLAQRSTSGPGTTNVVYAIDQPFGAWDDDDNVLVDTGYDDQDITNVCQRTNSTYALVYAFEPDWGWLQERQNILDDYRQQGFSDTSRQVVSETLNVMGLSWLLQTAGIEKLLAGQLGILPQYHYRFGRMAQEAGHGYYIDIQSLSGEWSDSGVDAASLNRQAAHYDLTAYFASALEHGIIEQYESTNVAASTVKMLQIANTNKQAVYLATPADWGLPTNVKGKLLHYDTATLNTLTADINAGYDLLLPQNGSNYVSGTSGWAGYGYVARLRTSGFPMTNVTGMIISGGYHGGYSSDSSGKASSSAVAQDGDSQPDAFTSTLFGMFGGLGADPVDMADGTFQVEHTDLSLGQAEPHGITLSRYYNGTRRESNPSGMAGGWVNNYSLNAVSSAAPQAALGGTTPAQMAAMVVATCAAAGVYDSVTPDPKNWLVSALIAKWGVDQLDHGGVSVMLGKDTVQFVRQPNGVFTPPADCTMSLTQNGSDYSLSQRHGNTFRFDSLGRLTNIVDQYNQSLNVAYNASNWVHTVTDWKGRALTFNYTGTPSRLTSVSDGTRTVSYGYSTAYNPQGDLTSFTDAEGKTTTYTYDTNHEITATIDAQSRLVVSNVCDSLGHVTTQYTQGDTNKAWQIFWSGSRTASFDPAGGETDYFYDDQGRLTDTVDPLGHETDTDYDGQNHVVETVSPLGEVNQFFYDGNNNLVETIDPLGFTNQFVYDSNNNLVKTIDPRGNASMFGYNAEFSLTGQTNGAGDFVNYSYTTSGSLAGTLASKADAGGTTSYGYDSTYGQLNSITYPGSLGGESFVNDSFGDVISHTDANENITTFSYNNRRQLTNTVAPADVISSVAFDAVGNVAGTTDPRGNVSSDVWSATRHLLSTTLPATAAGTPVVTNIYDNRDWLIETINPQLSTVSYVHDADERLISQTDPVSRTTTFGFDADNRNLAATNAAGEVTRQAWDAKGQLIQLTDGEGHTVLRAYDGAGNQIILTNRNGKKWQFQFDAANRLTNTITPLGRTTSETFNHQGLIASMKDPAGKTTTYGYDAKGRLTSRTDTIGTTGYKYDANNNVTNVSENGLTNSWTFDAYNRVSSCRDVYGNLIQYKYDASGNLTNLVYPGGKNVYYAFDSNNHLTNVTDWAGRKTSIGYDLNGRLTGITRPNGTQRIIGYDSAGEVTNILEETAVGFPIALFRHNWNTAAEMQWEFAAPLPHVTTLPTRTMTYDDDNRLAKVNSSSVNSDTNGNLTYGPLTNGTFSTYAFDARNRLLNAGGVTNVYDAMNNRIGQTYGTNSVNYIINPNAKLPQVLEQIKNGVTTYYIYGAGLLYQVTETATSTNVLYYHYDYRGSTVALTDDNGSVKDRFEYSLYGTLTYRVGDDDTLFLFNGRYGVQTDPNGLLYMRARYYNPYLCRFINPDPSGFKAGLNFYAAFNGNPVSMNDPSGLGAVGDEQNLSWLTGNNATPTDLGNPFGIATDGSNGWNYDTASTALGFLSMASDTAQYSLEGASIGINNSSGALSFYTHFYGNQSVSVTMISDIAEVTGPLFLAGGIAMDAANPNLSWGQVGANAGVGGTALGISTFVEGGGPIGASLAGGYFIGGLIQAPVNNAIEQTFQTFTDIYYGNFTPNVGPIVMPPPH